MTTSSNTTGFASFDWLMSTIKKNPEGLLLLAAGSALLLRTGSSGGPRPSQQYQGGPMEYGEQSPQMQHAGSRGKDWEIPEGISQAAENARDYASNVSKTVGEKTRSFAAAAGEYVDGARDTIKSQSGRIAQQTQSIELFESSRWLSRLLDWRPELRLQLLSRLPKSNAKLSAKPQNDWAKSQAVRANGSAELLPQLANG